MTLKQLIICNDKWDEDTMLTIINDGEWIYKTVHHILVDKELREKYVNSFFINSIELKEEKINTCIDTVEELCFINDEYEMLDKINICESNTAEHIITTTVENILTGNQYSKKHVVAFNEHNIFI